MERFDATAHSDMRVATLATHQHGVVALAQLRAAGLGDGAIALRVRAGRLHRLHRGVFAVGHARVSREGRWLAAVLALGDDAVLSHTSAAALWGLRPPGGARIHVTVPTTAGRGRRSGLVVHRTRGLRPADIAVRDGIPVTSLERTLIDIAGMLRPAPLERALERSLTQRLLDAVALRAALDANATRPGAALLGRLLFAVGDEPQLTRSRLEELMHDLVDAHGVEPPERNVHIAGHEVDVLWRDRRLVVETDGFEHHGTRAAFERDRARDAQLTALGYRVVRFTYRQLTDEPAGVAAMLRTLIAGPGG